MNKIFIKLLFLFFLIINQSIAEDNIMILKFAVLLVFGYSTKSPDKGIV